VDVVCFRYEVLSFPQYKWELAANIYSGTTTKWHTRQLFSPWNKAQLALNGLHVVIPKAGGENLPQIPHTAPWGGVVAQKHFYLSQDFLRFVSVRNGWHRKLIYYTELNSHISFVKLIHYREAKLSYSSIYIVVARPNFNTFFQRLKNAVDVSFVSKSCKCWQYENRQENRAQFTPQEMLPVRRTLVIRWKCLETKTNRRSERVYYYTIPHCQRTRHKDHRHCTKYTRMSACSRHTAERPSWHRWTSQNLRSTTRTRSKPWEITFPRRWIQ